MRAFTGGFRRQISVSWYILQTDGSWKTSSKTLPNLDLSEREKKDAKGIPLTSIPITLLEWLPPIRSLAIRSRTNVYSSTCSIPGRSSSERFGSIRRSRRASHYDSTWENVEKPVSAQ
jgi:hypothetical protein